jgi:ankyrin repeat protein
MEYEAAEFLLRRGADPNQTTIDGKSPLLLAAVNNCLDLITMLKAYGADPIDSNDYAKILTIKRGKQLHRRTLKLLGF